MGRAKIVILGILPCLLFLITAGANSRRLHPPPTKLDLLARRALLQADTVEVRVEHIEYYMGGGSTTELVATLDPAETLDVVRNLNLTKEREDNWGTGFVPIVYFRFCSKGKPIGSLSTGYGGYGFHYFVGWNMLKGIDRGLHPTSIVRLRQVVSRHPEIIKALIQQSAEKKYLSAETFAPNKH